MAKIAVEVTSPIELRSLLIESAKAVVDGRLTVQQANSVSGLSSEVHKSLKMEYVGQMLDSGAYSINDGRLHKVLEAK
jgi:hypothetical protein